MWNFLSLNVYLNQIEEKDGIRRVRVPSGWIIETEKNSGILFNRLVNTNDEQIIYKSLLNEKIYNSYGSIENCFSIWLTPFKKEKIKIEKDVLNYYINKFDIYNNINYLKKIYLSYEINSLKNNWNEILLTKNDTEYNAVQLYISKLLLKTKGKKYLEMGVENNYEGSSWILSDLDRKIFCNKLSDDLDTPNASKNYFLSSNTINNIPDLNSYSFLLHINNEYNLEKARSLIEYCKNNKKELMIVSNLELSYENFEKQKIFLNEKHITNLYTLNMKLKLKEEIDLMSEIKISNFIKKDKICDIQEVNENNKVLYRSISKVSEPVGMLSQRLEYNTYQALLKAKNKYGDFDSFVSKKLNLEKENLGDSLSAEQVDILPLVLDKFNNNEGFLLADETGFGKGRALASVAISALKDKNLVLFVSEKTNLFSDFFRDLTDVDPEFTKTISPVILYGGSSRLHIYDNDNNLIASSYTKKYFDLMLKSKKIPDDKTLFIMTTYSQLNKPYKYNKKEFIQEPIEKDKNITEEQKNNKEKKYKIVKTVNEKMDWLLSVLENHKSIIILDESHTAAGDSNINDNIEMCLKLCNGVMYSSATYVKTEKNLSAYQKAIPLPKWCFNIIDRALQTEEFALRELLTNLMAKNGNFIRREHKTIIPPTPILIPLNKEISDSITLFGNIWKKIATLCVKTEALKKKNYGNGIWDKVGAILSRTIKEFFLLARIDYLIEEIENKINQNEKVVVFFEKTLESSLKLVLLNKYGVCKNIKGNNNNKKTELLTTENDEDSDDELVLKDLNNIEMDSIPTWKEKFSIILDGLVNLDILSNPQEYVISNLELINIKKEKEIIVELIKNLPDWDLMPFDKIKNKLKEKNITCDELSGRNYELIVLDNKKYKIVPREKISRTMIVNKFNNGETDVELLTNAACSGISLHASAKVKDQRVRNFIEVDIAVNPSNRIQSWGRVKRKDQVVEPNMYALIFDFLSEKRIIERESIKREKLSAHTGTLIKRDELSYLSEDGELITNEWMYENPELSKRLGLNSAVGIEKVDKMLVRSIILNENVRDNFINKLDNGLLLMDDIFNEKKNKTIDDSYIIRESWLYGYPDYHKTSDLLYYPSINVVERILLKDHLKKDNKKIEQLYNKKYLDSQLKLNEMKNFFYSMNRIGVGDNYQLRSIYYWLNSLFQKLTVGATIKITEPVYQNITYGVIKDIIFPKEILDNNVFSLTQFAIKVLLVDYDHDINIPLYYLYHDKSFSILDKEIPLSSFLLPYLNKKCVSIEGNPILASLWGSSWGLGSNILLNDKDVGLDWFWILPEKYNYSYVKSLPLNLINAEHAIRFITKFKEIKLYGSVPLDKIFTMVYNGDLMKITLDYDTFKNSKDKWLNYQTISKLDKKYYFEHGKCIIEVPKKYVNYFLYVMENFGISFRIDFSYKDWYIESSRELMKKIVSKNLDLVSKLSKGKVREKKKQINDKNETKIKLN